MGISEIIETLNSPYVSVESTVFKLLVAFVAGGLVGLNRQRHKQPAGFRTHILICLGAALLMVLSIYIPQTYFNFKTGDPGRIAAQVVSGIGFLGAGAIIRLGANIKGITTAASIWLTSAIGLCVGAGLYIISAVAVALALFTLIILEIVEQKWFPPSKVKNIFLEFSSVTIPIDEISILFQQNKITITDYNLSVYSSIKKSTFQTIAQISENQDLATLCQQLGTLQEILSVKIE